MSEFIHNPDDARPPQEQWLYQKIAAAEARASRPLSPGWYVRWGRNERPLRVSEDLAKVIEWALQPGQQVIHIESPPSPPDCGLDLSGLEEAFPGCGE